MAKPSLRLLLLAAITSSILLLPAVCTEGGTLNQSQSLRHGENLTSQERPSFFQLGFFATNGSTSKEGKSYLAVSYVGPSYSRVVWVANRGTPITDSTAAVANISADGTLRLYQGSQLIWQTPNSIPSTDAVVLQLLHTGNLVVKDLVTGRWLWQSFDYPTDTMLPTMRLGKDMRTGRKVNITSWKSADDPSPGQFTYGLCEGGGRSREMCITGADGSIRYRTGPWNGRRFSGNTKIVEAAPDINFSFVVSKTGATYYSFDIVSNTEISMSWLVMRPTGTADREVVRANESRTLLNLWSRPTESCDRYSRCGPNGLCANDGCGCLPGFWKPGKPTLAGLIEPVCEREGKPDCGEGDWFQAVQDVKLPDTFDATTEADGSTSLEGCRTACKTNCSCIAYAAADVSTGTGCIRWSGDLLDARLFSVTVQDGLFVRVPASFHPSDNTSGRRRKAILASSISLIAVIIIVSCGFYVCKRFNSTKEIEIGFVQSIRSGATNWEEELSLFDYAAIACATRNFSDKIGEGGFGIVYKGTLGDGRVVAVKRLTNQISEQGLDGFLNEAALIAKLQHKNLIRLLGCCTEVGERMLVYEHMCNGSLDTFIFDERQRGMLDWTTRANIIVGVARGLVYLHEDSRLKIIHRDLKAGNVLLDEAMNPKISDFGSARLFVADQAEDKTRNVVGTIGYISPEYALDGTFSVKSDVFSFGVLMLEIISGTKNRATFHEVMDKNLLALAWRLWREGKSMELLDEKIQNSHPEKVRRYVQIGLLCVQEDADDRPTMSGVHSMLTNEEKRLEEPNKPGIYQGRVTANKNHLQSSGSGSVGYMTTTVVEAR